MKPRWNYINHNLQNSFEITKDYAREVKELTSSHEEVDTRLVGYSMQSMQ